MVQAWIEHCTRQRRRDRVDRQVAGSFPRHRRAHEALQQAQAQVGPGHQPRRGDDVAIVQQRLLGLDPHLGKTLGKRMHVVPVGTGRAPVEQTTGGDENTPMHTDASTVPCPCNWHNDARWCSSSSPCGVDSRLGGMISTRRSAAAAGGLSGASCNRPASSACQKLIRTDGNSTAPSSATTRLATRKRSASP